MKTIAWKAGIIAGLIAGSAHSADAFTATSFRVAAATAPVIALGMVSKGREGKRVFNVIRTIRGKVGPTFAYNPRIAGFHRELEVGSTYLVLISADGKPFTTVNVCGTNNVLEIKDGLVSNPEEFDSTFDLKDVPKKILPLIEVEDTLRLETKI